MRLHSKSNSAISGSTLRLDEGIDSVQREGNNSQDGKIYVQQNRKYPSIWRFRHLRE